MKAVVITCQTNQPEIEKLNTELNCNYPVIYMDTKLHDRPEKLRLELQEQLDSITGIDYILLAMGLCGKAVIGLKAGDFKIVVPRVDDCLTLFLGSQKKRQEFSEEASTYFFTKGWLESNNNIGEEYQRILAKYGKANTEFVFRTMYGYFKRLALIDTGLFELDPQIIKLDHISQLLKLGTETVPGSLALIRKLLLGPHDDDFISVGPFEVITTLDLMCK